MIPILYDKNEVSFVSNGLGRLRDCISCIVTEERNGIYECDFEYPMNGANYDLIQVGRIIGVTHDEGDDIQPFDIVSFSKPINGIVAFHAVHISYRQSYMTVVGKNINSLSDAFDLFLTATPTNPFTYNTDKNSAGYLGCADGIPRTVRSMLGGIEGSVLDAYGGEYEWNRWTVNLWSARGKLRDFEIRYGINMLEYDEDCDASGCYSSCIPYWTDNKIIVVGDKQTATGITPSGREMCIPLDVSQKFEKQPKKAQVNSMGLSVMNSKNPTLPSQNIKVSFARLQDMGVTEYDSLLQCKLCDRIKVLFPDYSTDAIYKIVKTKWNVLTEKYDEMELGNLSTSLSNALGISQQNGRETTVSNSTFNPTTGSAYSSYGGCYYETYGDIVHVHVGVSGLTSNTGATIYTLPTELKPSTTIFAHGTGGSASNIGYLEVRTSGDIYVRSNGGTYVGADAFYMI